MDSPGDYSDSQLNGEDGDEVVYQCKGCDNILEEGKAFELAGNRWHLDCFRCNTCGTLLDSESNLLLLGDGSLICNNCTYSCSACGNKIDDLAILTSDQAFCATCFRCRNCKRKIENLRYARTSQGIFCMNCHESLMARRRKKSRAAASAKKKDESPMVDKSLPALPPSADMTFSPAREVAATFEIEIPTELSPRPRPSYPQIDSSSGNISHRQRETSPERTSSDNGQGLTLPTSTYKSHRHSTISHTSDFNNADGETFFIPLALDPTPAETPYSINSETWEDTWRKGKDNRQEKDYFTGAKPRSHSEAQSQPRSREASSASTPHIAFQEKGRNASAEETIRIQDSIRNAQAAASKGTSNRSSPAIANDDLRNQVVTTPAAIENDTKGQSQSEQFQLGEVPKGRKSSSKPDIEMPTNDVNASHVQLHDTSYIPPRKEIPARTEAPLALQADKYNPARNHESNGPAPVPAPRLDTSAQMIPRKEVAREAPLDLNNVSSLASASSASSTSSEYDTPGPTPTANGKPHLEPAEEELVPPQRAPGRANQSKVPPMPSRPQPVSTPTGHHKETSNSVGNIPSSQLPQWASSGDFTMDEDMARILGNGDESTNSMLRRISNSVRHGRTASEASLPNRQRHSRSISETARNATSPRWSRTPVTENHSIAVQDISSPISLKSPGIGRMNSIADDSVLLRRQLRNSELRVAELERQFSNENDLKSLNKKLIEKRKTVSFLDSQAEVMIQQLEVLAGFVEQAKDGKTAINTEALEESAIKEFVQRLDQLKDTLTAEIEALIAERNELIEEKTRIMADRDRALLEFEQLSSKNAQLADMNNDLTHQIQERFKAQTAVKTDSENTKPHNGLGIYTHHHKDKSVVSITSDETTRRPSTGTAFGSTTTTVYAPSVDQDPIVQPTTILQGPMVVDIRKGQAKKTFNWKKGGNAVAKGVSKGFKGAFSSGQERGNQWPTAGGEIGMPYNMTVTPVESPNQVNTANMPRSSSNDAARKGFGLFNKGGIIPRSTSAGTVGPVENPSTLFGSELIERAEYERRQIPSVVTRCIEEVELRGMDIEGIYRKTGGAGQVKMVQEGFDKNDDYDISDPGLDITAVTSVLKQYFRKLPTPLLTFEVYDRVLESTMIEDDNERCVHLRKTFNSLPPKHRDCLEFLVFHLARVAMRQVENLMTPKNLAVVFAPTIMRDESIEREMTDMHAKNNAMQFVIENSNEIFASD